MLISTYITASYGVNGKIIAAGKSNYAVNSVLKRAFFHTSGPKTHETDLLTVGIPALRMGAHENRNI